jgi:hypothetical protein
MQYYVQDSNGVWHVKDLHPMGLTKVKAKHQLHFPTTDKACPVCRRILREKHRQEQYLHRETE